MRYAVCIPTCGRTEVLERTLTAVLAQRPAPGAVWLVDNNEDPTYLDAIQLPAGVGKTSVRSGVPQSDPAGSNCGLQLAAQFGYEYLIKWDDDLIPLPGCFKALVAPLESYDSVVAVGGLYPSPENQGRLSALVDGQLKIPDERPNHLQFFPWEGRRRRFVVHHLYSSFAYRVSRALLVGGFCEDYSLVAHRHETDFTMRLDAVGDLMVDTNATAIHLVEAGGTRRFSQMERHGMVNLDEEIFRRRMVRMDLLWNLDIETVNAAPSDPRHMVAVGGIGPCR